MRSGQKNGGRGNPSVHQEEHWAESQKEAGQLPQGILQLLRGGGQGSQDTQGGIANRPVQRAVRSQDAFPQIRGIWKGDSWGKLQWSHWEQQTPSMGVMGKEKTAACQLPAAYATPFQVSVMTLTPLPSGRMNSLR